MPIISIQPVQQHWEGFYSSQPAAAIVIVFGPQLSQSHKIRLFPKSPPRNLWTWKERDISREDQTEGSKRGKESNSRVKTVYFLWFILGVFFPLSIHFILMTASDIWWTYIERYRPSWTCSKGHCRWALLPSWCPQKLLGCSTQSSSLTPFTLCFLPAKAPQSPQAANCKDGN